MTEVIRLDQKNDIKLHFNNKRFCLITERSRVNMRSKYYQGEAGLSYISGR